MSGYEFNITITATETSCEYHTPTSRNGRIRAPLVLKPHLETAGLLELWLQRWHQLPEDLTDRLVDDTFNVLGEHLWAMAFDNGIGAKIIDALGEIRKEPEDSRPSIRVRISVSEDYAARPLASLPWEFLRYPKSKRRLGFFLASELNIVLGRWVSDVGQDRAKARDPEDKVVRVLFVLSLPRDHTYRTESGRFTTLCAELRQLQRGKVPALEILDPINEWKPDQVETVLRQNMSDARPIDIVHLIAVCKSDGDHGSKLLLAKDGDRDVFQNAESVTSTLIREGAAQPALVVLHLSDYEGAHDEVSEHFERLAPEFIKAGIPAVLAMQYPMSQGVDVGFLKGFYEKLAGGQAIGSAVQEARRSLQIGKAPLRRHFGAVVLYQQDADEIRLVTQPLLTDEADLAVRVRSTVSRPAEAPRSIREQLLEWNWNYGHRTAREVYAQINEWIESKPWPQDSPEGWHKAKQALQGRRREKNDDARIRSALDHLLGKVESRLLAVTV